MNSTPILSVVTVVLNDKSGLELTLKSLISQSYKSFEVLVIDGSSTDGTLSVANSYLDKFLAVGISLKIISEPDFGVYDAMNKGVRNATGEWLIFMNSGDYFYNSDSMFALSNFVDSDYGVIYGDSLFIDNGSIYTMKSSNIDMIKKKMPFCHQSTFIRKKLLVNSPYSTDFQVVSDFHFFLGQYLSGVIFKKVDSIIACHDMHGLSNKKSILAHREKKMILRQYGLIVSRSSIFFNDLIFCSKFVIKYLLGFKLLGLIRKAIYR